MRSESSVITVGVEDSSSEDVCNNLAVDSDDSNSSLTAVESENDLVVIDSLESSSDGSCNEADELDMSFTETDDTDHCLGDVTCEPVNVSTTTADGPLASVTNSTDTKLAATASIDDDDHRHFIDSDAPYSDLKQRETHISESMLMSHVAMDIN